MSNNIEKKNRLTKIVAKIYEWVPIACTDPWSEYNIRNFFQAILSSASLCFFHCQQVTLPFVLTSPKSTDPSPFLTFFWISRKDRVLLDWSLLGLTLFFLTWPGFWNRINYGRINLGISSLSHLWFLEGPVWSGCPEMSDLIWLGSDLAWLIRTVWEVWTN